MRIPYVFFTLVPLLVGCPGNAGGLGTTSDSSSGDQGPETETSPATTSATTEVGTLDGSASGSGSVSVSSDGSGSGSSTASSDASGSGSGTGTGDESSSGSETGEGPGVGEPYGPCDDQGECLGDNQCYDDYPSFDMCLAPCGPGPVFACPDAPGGTAYPECIGAVGVLCMLNCQGGLECPQGTTCEEVFTDIFRCLWP